MELKKFMIMSYLFLLILVTQIPNGTSQEVEDEREFSYVVGDDHGPEKWGLIHHEWEICSNGTNQSPIDLSHNKVEVYHELGPMRRTYRPSNATMVNRGHDIMLKWEEGAGGFWVNGTEYVLRQLHWHSPSEHTLNNKSFDLELHMVHQSANGEIAVVGILYKLGRPDTFLSEMEKYISAIQDTPDGRETVGLVDPRHIKRGSRKYYRYLGSLTTPPCTEGVVWTIISKVRTVSRDQVNLLREAVEDKMEKNARPQQQISGRTVRYYRPKRNLIK